jgi:hypothetical protein
MGWHDYVTDIGYNGYRVNLLEYGPCRKRVYKKAGRGDFYGLHVHGLLAERGK